LSFGGGSVRTSLLPKIIANANVPAVIRRYFVDYLICGGAFALVLAALAPEIVHLLAGSKYESDVQLIPILCGAILALELYSYGQALAVARRHPQQAFYSIAAGAVVALVLVPLLCYTIGAEGVPLGLLGGYVLASAFLLGRNGLISWRSLASLAGLAVVLGALYVQYRHPDTIWSIPSRSMRYVLAGIGAGLGLALLRKLGKENTHG
jgi:O-antigen/teichoic acid export membrane protein